MTEERGLKINVALAHSPKRKRAQVARLMLEALAIVPLFSSDDNVVFHADPHAGNLLYDSVTGNLTILDWALTERLSREQRRHLGLLFIFVALRDAVAASLEIEALREKDRRNGTCDDEMVRRCVQEFIDQLPFARVPKVTEPMRLLESLAMKGVRFPGSLVMLSKVMLMIDGILYGLGASRAEFGLPLARYLAHKVVFDRKSISTSLTARDYIAIQLSSLLLVARLGVRTQELLVQELLPRAQTS